MAKDLPLSALEMTCRLKKKWSPPEWVVLTEIRNTVGASSRERYADVLAFSTYPSRGLRLIGCELKSSRSDVIRELQNPDKAHAIQRYCDFWYLIIGRKDLISPDELPPKWGLMVPFGENLRTEKQAPQLEPEQWPRSFVASLIRDAHLTAPAERLLVETRDKAFLDGLEQGKKSGASERRHMELELEGLRKRYSALCGSIGADPHGYAFSSAQHTAEMFKKFQEAGVTNARLSAIRIRSFLRREVEYLTECADRLESFVELGLPELPVDDVD